MNDFREVMKSLCDVGVLENKSKGKNTKFRVKYNSNELELIFVDDKLFNMFRLKE